MIKYQFWSLQCLLKGKDNKLLFYFLKEYWAAKSDCAFGCTLGDCADVNLILEEPALISFSNPRINICSTLQKNKLRSKSFPL